MPQWGEGEYLTEFNYYTPDTGGLEGAFAADASRLTAPMQVLGENWLFAKRAFIGWPTLETDGAFNWISRRLPLPYFDELDTFENPWLYASSIARVEGVGPRGETDTGCPVFDLMRMWVTFTSRSYDILVDGHKDLASTDSGAALGPHPDEATLLRYISGPFWKPYSRQVTLRRGLMTSVDISGDTGGTNTLTEGIARPESGATITYIWHEVPIKAIPYITIRKTMNKVNAAAFDPRIDPNGRFAAETLLFESPDIKIYQDPTGTYIADIQYTFRYLPRAALYGPNAGTARGWNWLLTHRATATDKAQPHYDYREYTLPGGDHAFESADFSALFRPDQP